MIDDRIAVLAHELRSPVAALQAIAAAFPSGDVSQRVRLLELARAAVANVERLVVDASVASLLREHVDPGAVVRDVVEAWTLAGIHVRADVGGALPQLDGDPVRLRQALDNLIGNAVGHSPRDAEIVVSARAEGSVVRLAVADRGEGIAAEELERIFEPSVRLTGTRTGAGLGLAIVRAVAAAHGGTAQAESAPGQGATFTLSLPASARA